ncbi:MAG: DUF1697 domain-containing protein [Solirubrobacterales bacterium]|nr:DUF1697 domain-containing protein [Solirubrobacterales bacterium]
MARNRSQILLLRGINLGPHKRVSMPELRALLTDAGFEDVQTYVASGNVVLTSSLSADKLVAKSEKLIAERFGFDVDVIVRTADELAEVVRLNPLADVVDNPKRYQVSFCNGEPDPKAVEKVAAAAAPSEKLVAVGRELYAWHPDGVGRSKMWTKLAGTGLGVRATARNWTTVTKLLEMADEG